MRGVKLEEDSPGSFVLKTDAEGVHGSIGYGEDGLSPLVLGRGVGL